MARNPAVRKAAKAAKRKAVVAEKRKQEIAANTPAAQIRRSAKLPIVNCLLSDALFDTGVGTVLLTRGVSREEQHVACFLLDGYCLGVKDAFFRIMDRQQADHLLDAWQIAQVLEPVEPGEVRKLLHDLVAWAASNGFQPHKDFVLVATLFGDVVPADTDYTTRFGLEGKVFYIPGPSEATAEVRQRTKMIRSRFGEAAVEGGGLVLDALEYEDDFEDDDVLEGELVTQET